MKIVVLAGGLSPEREVSLSSGSLIANALREAGHRTVLVDLYKGLGPARAPAESLFRGRDDGTPYAYAVSEEVPDLSEMRRAIRNREPQVGPGVLEICRLADVVFLALHGAAGENGQVQALFDLLGIRYTGSGYDGCLLAMDKDLTKQLLARAGLPTARWLTAPAASVTAAEIEEKIGLPCVVKPCGAGSSIGITIAENRGQLERGIAAAREVESRILAEEKIAGAEYTVGILDGQALPVVEIVPKQGFYDYRNKYQQGLTDEICPARLGPEDTRKVQELALETHRVLRLGAYSRVDFIRGGDGVFYCLEANTLPGMTPTSLVPRAARAAGIPYAELCDRIARLAL